MPFAEWRHLLGTDPLGRDVLERVLLGRRLTVLGLGVDPQIPTWCGMLAAGRNDLQTSRRVSVLPGMAIILPVLGLDLFSDWPRDRLDPLRKV